MKNIFVYGSSFSTYIFVNSINYLLNINIGYINLLKENHTFSEFGKNSDRIKLYNKVTDCILNSDILIILDNHKLPPQILTDIVISAEKFNKILVPIDFLFDYKSKKGNFCSFNTQTPTILNISIGNNSGNLCIEMLLSKIFSDLNVNYFQSFSDQAETMTQKLQGKKLLNNKIINAISKNCSKYDAAIITLNYSSFQDMTNHCAEILSFFPDYIILNTSYRFMEYKKIESFIHYKFGVPLLIIKSNYVEVYRAENSMKCIYCKEKLQDVNYINDENLEQKLKLEILSTLTFPKDVYML